jgi:hypothetical protein
MTSPSSSSSPDTPQPRDIALEQETPDQAADLEAQSQGSEQPDES